MQHPKSLISHILADHKDILKFNWMDPTFCPTQQGAFIIAIRKSDSVILL